MIVTRYVKALADSIDRYIQASTRRNRPPTIPTSGIVAFMLFTTIDGPEEYAHRDVVGELEAGRYTTTIFALPPISFGPGHVDSWFSVSEGVFLVGIYNWGSIAKLNTDEFIQIRRLMESLESVKQWPTPELIITDAILKRDPAAQRLVNRHLVALGYDPEF